MKKTDTASVKKEIVIIITIVAFISGFLGGIIYSALKSPAGPSSYPDSGAAAIPARDIPLPTDRIAELEQELAVDPDNVKAMIELGDIYFDSNRYQEGIVIFTRAEKIAPTDIHILNDLGVMHLHTGNYETALEKFKAVLAIYPTHSHTLYYLGLVYLKQGDRDKALPAFEQVLALNPDPQLAEAARREIAALNEQTLFQ
ncbi:MAG: tetratricopeptide repeat protein [Desulfobacterales bacterium]|nr:tetratricopeptide repeat protein [Desulfobacterales bacterium]